MDANAMALACFYFEVRLLGGVTASLICLFDISTCFNSFYCKYIVAAKAISKWYSIANVGRKEIAN